MGCEKLTADLLRENGHKLTPQRMMIVSAVRHAGGHRTAAEVLDAVRHDAPYVDASTVYRTLGVLKDLRLVTETDVGEGESVYEWIQEERHHHLICKLCGGIERLDHRFLEDLSAEIMHDAGFQADLDHFAIFGTCSICSGSPKASFPGRSESKKVSPALSASDDIRDGDEDDALAADQIGQRLWR
jgi:Fur family transcriptional regulator, ferric uptake regulator